MNFNYDYEPTEFSKSVLAGVFAGIATTLAVLIYNFIYRGISGFSLSDIVNVSSVIFVSVLLLTIGGFIFHLFHHYVKQGTLVFIVVSVILTILSIYMIMGVERSPNPVMAAQFKKLMLGVVIITGAFWSFGIPYLFNSDKI
ncbi:MAG: hypothetical protein JSU03_05945 [Bacteroidetes bacterium]|nr:hypothetical protein [Bacteroidota bacterium]MBS1756802.1 hypothetical protein [Bacteroidota bacterium]